MLPEKDLAKVAWFRINSQNLIHPVARLHPDALQLYDLLGNVAEWGDDWIKSARDQARDGKPLTTVVVLIFGGDAGEAANRLHCRTTVYTEPLSTYERSGFRLLMPAENGR